MTIARWLLIPLLFGGLLSHGGDADGRRGNTLYERGAFAEAEQAYREGLTRVDASDSTRNAALYHNLAAALYQQERYAEADETFQNARDYATDVDARVRIHYNQATNAARAGNREAALRHYRTTLRLDPLHDDARHNYEVLMRQQPPAPGRADTPDVDPSDYAQRLKRRAEALAAQRDYSAALMLMQEGLAQDSTVAAYQDFMGRLNTITAIDRNAENDVQLDRP
ncbi:MAG: hypothetical protein PPP56_05440 [Longimonas sp.]|uniref:tetratricopeptide repeat protein n=1 Tax=Longimonas sp. TaxID=2039626 RepID=UPI00335C296D